MNIDWWGLFVPALSVAEKVLRTALVFGFLVVALRLAGKRELAQLNPFDFVVLLVLSNTLQNAVIGNDNSVSGGIVGATTLLVLGWVFNRVVSRWPRLERLLVGRRVSLIRGGVVDHRALRRENLTVAELEEAAHRQGIGSLAHVQRAALEPDGQIFFEADDQRVLHERLDRLTAEVAALRAALADRPPS